MLPNVVGLVSGLAVVAIILGLLTHSFVTALSSGATGGGSNSTNSPGLKSEVRDLPVAPGLTAVSTVILCNGDTLVSVGRGPIYHQYIMELLAETDLTGGQASTSSCVRTGLGRDDFR